MRLTAVTSGLATVLPISHRLVQAQQWLTRPDTSGTMS